MHFSYTFLVLLLLHCTNASQGDRSQFYQNCLINCINKNCTDEGENFTPEAEQHQAFMNRVLRWSCGEECRYSCMWNTMRAYEERGWPHVKFHGKWPFKRALGVQEWGSVLGSVLNLAAHLLMWNKLHAAFSARNTPLFWLWRTFAVVSIHGWLWSIVFHARDTPFTEFMDYACALSMVMILFIACVVRLTYGHSHVAAVLAVGGSVVYYASHTLYLFSGDIDYEYNMMANIVPGALAVILWSVWGLKRYRRYRYTWRLLVFNVLATLFLSLELLDFPPYLSLWDAHALWHLSTAPLPFLFYGFVFDDLIYLRKSWPDSLPKSDTKLC